MFSRRLVLAGLISAVGGCAEARHHLRVDSLEIVNAAGVAHRFKVEVVDTPASRERGLMYRTFMAPDAGMLFDFKRADQVSFWMKNTYIPLDIIFIGADGHILNIAEGAKPFDETPLPSAGEALGVLEINGGRAEQLGIAAGDLVRHPLFKTAR